MLSRFISIAALAAGAAMLPSIVSTAGAQTAGTGVTAGSTVGAGGSMSGNSSTPATTNNPASTNGATVGSAVTIPNGANAGMSGGSMSGNASTAAGVAAQTEPRPMPMHGRRMRGSEMAERTVTECLNQAAAAHTPFDTCKR